MGKLREELRQEQRVHRERARELDAARRQMRVPPKGWRPEDMDAAMQEAGGSTSPGERVERAESSAEEALVESLREELGREAKRVIDLMRAWDENHDGMVGGAPSPPCVSHAPPSTWAHTARTHHPLPPTSTACPHASLPAAATSHA